MLRRGNDMMVIGFALLVISVIAAVWAPDAFDWGFVCSGAFGIIVGSLERAKAART